MKQILLLFFSLIALTLSAQSYTSYFTGNAEDLVSSPQGGVCMMGGATENDEAMKWFLNRANGGDVLVLRASGSDGYNDYLYSELGIAINSVESIVFNNSSATDVSYIHDKIKQAEAIWFAGGDQWKYVAYWRNNTMDSLINDAIENRNIVIGGTSAGMAILGGFYFTAQNGTVTSTTALNEPYNARVRVDSAEFLTIDYLQDVITDTHYNDPDRKGRHMVFLARILTDYGIAAKGIACNEYTSVCIDEHGLARVYGDYPTNDETAFFLQTNCELSDINPENCSLTSPLDWDLDGSAVRVYKVNGTSNGSNTFSLSDWETGEGGSWENWYVDKGIFNETSGLPISCVMSSEITKSDHSSIKVYPNPFTNIFSVIADSEILEIALRDVNSKLLVKQSDFNRKTISVDKATLPSGMYFLTVETQNGLSYYKLLKN